VPSSSAGQPAKASTRWKACWQDDPEYADAYDVMGRAQFELGNFENALSTFKMATQLTPVVHQPPAQARHAGLLHRRPGRRHRAAGPRATRIGVDSKMFDPQALVLLALARLDNNDKKGMTRVVEQLNRLKERSFEPERPYRLLEFVRALESLLNEQEGRVTDEVKHLTEAIQEPWFDFEMATNLMGLLVRVVQRRVQVYEVEKNIEKLGMRFCTSRSLSELLASAAAGNEAFSRIVHDTHTRILKLTEQAMTLAIKGDPRGTVMRLLEDGRQTCNAKLIESAWQVLNRYEDRIEGADELRQQIGALRDGLQTHHQITRMGEASSPNAAPGGVALPSGYKPPRREGLLDRMRTD
jgi:tetratricopeptide (TPR) repeat protein